MREGMREGMREVPAMKGMLDGVTDADCVKSGDAIQSQHKN